MGVLDKWLRKEVGEIGGTGDLAQDDVPTEKLFANKEVPNLDVF